MYWAGANMVAEFEGVSRGKGGGGTHVLLALVN